MNALRTLLKATPPQALMPAIDSPRARLLRLQAVETRVRQAWVVEVRRPDGTWSPVAAHDRKAPALEANGGAM